MQNFCNNKVPSTLQYNVWSSFRSHLTDENSKSTSPLFNTLLYKKNFFRSLRLRHLPPFDWKFLKIGILRAKDLRKNVPILQKGGFIPAPLTLLAIRVVLLHKMRFVKSFNSPTVYMYKFI